MDKYVVITKGSIRYYIRESLIEHLETAPHQSELRYTQYADFVVDSDANQLIKCRYLMQDIVDKYCGV